MGIFNEKLFNVRWGITNLILCLSPSEQQIIVKQGRRRIKTTTEKKTVATKTDCSNSYFCLHLWKLSVKSAVTLNWLWHSVNIAEQPVSQRDTPSCMPAVVCHPATSFEVLQPTRLHEEWARTDWGCKMAYHVSALTIRMNPSLKQ